MGRTFHQVSSTKLHQATSRILGLTISTLRSISHTLLLLQVDGPTKIWAIPGLYQYLIATPKKGSKWPDWRSLYLDGHVSHLSMRFIDYCIDHRILLVNYLPHSTYRLQPLDVGCFGPPGFKYSTFFSPVATTQGYSCISKRQFFPLFGQAFLRAMTEKNIHCAFEKTGIVPFDPTKVLTKVTLDSDTNVERLAVRNQVQVRFTSRTLHRRNNKMHWKESSTR
jgi:hypothetical protein